MKAATEAVTEAIEEAVARAGAVLVYSLVRALTEAGVKPAASFRLAAAMVVSNGLGDESFRTLGVSKTTWYRWKREIRAAGVSAPEDIPPEYLTDVMALLGVRA